MKFLVLALVFFAFTANGQNILGKWKTIDDRSGKDKSIVEIFQKGGKLFGKIVKIYTHPGDDPDPVCDECDEGDDRYLKKVVGLEIIRNMAGDGDNSYDDGEILDPESGKVYRCKIWLDGEVLMVRGYWGLFFRTQTWKRLN